MLNQILPIAAVHFRRAQIAAWASRDRETHATARTPAREAAGRSELHLVETVEQGLGVLVVAGLARIVGAQRHAAHAGKLLGVDLRILLFLELVPEALVGLAAVHL